jgi:hypothetical protein
VLTFEMVVDALAVPFGPSDPEVFTVSWPELKKLACPTVAEPDGAEALTGVLEASAARVTDGVGPAMLGGLPKRLTLMEYPYALPFTAVTFRWLAVAGPAPTLVKTREAARAVPIDSRARWIRNVGAPIPSARRLASVASLYG